MNEFVFSFLSQTLNMAISELNSYPFPLVNQSLMIALILILIVKLIKSRNFDFDTSTFLQSLLKVINLIATLYSLVRFSFVISYITDQFHYRNKIASLIVITIILFGTDINVLELIIVSIIEKLSKSMLQQYKQEHVSDLISLFTLLSFTVTISMYQIVVTEHESPVKIDLLFLFALLFFSKFLNYNVTSNKYTGIAILVLFVLYETQWQSQHFHAMIWPCLFLLAFLQLIDNKEEDVLLTFQDTNQNSLSIWKQLIIHINTDKDAKKLLIQLALNFTFMFVECIYGMLSNSLGLISDSLHMLIDSSALAIALFASLMAKQKPNSTFTFGYERVEVLSGFANGIFLLFAVVEIISESFERLINPQTVLPKKMMVVSIMGLIVNVIGLFFFHNHSHMHSEEEDEKLEEEHHHDHEHHHNCDHHHHHNHNLSGVYLHILADALGSVACIISAILIYYYEFYIADPITSIIISLLILTTTYQLLKDTSRILLLYLPYAGKNIINKLEQEFEDNDIQYEEQKLWQIKEKKYVYTAIFSKQLIEKKTIIQSILNKYNIFIKAIEFK